MTNYAYINGQKIGISDKSIEEIKAIVARDKDAFTISPGDMYYCINAKGEIVKYRHRNDDADEKLKAVANLCTDNHLMEMRALQETLSRLLWRYSEQHGGDEPWGNSDEHYNIYFHADIGKFFVDCWHACRFQGAFFRSKEIAEAAIHDIVEPFIAEHPELLEYLTGGNR